MLPCKVFIPRPNGKPKILTTTTQKELEALQKIGWKVYGES